ncbi:sugar ABC transporter substrate-binding protein [Arthrobacter pigmenti]
MRKFRTSLAIAAVTALGLTACGSGGGGGGNGGGGGSAEGETLSVWIMEGTNPNADAFFKKAGKKFKEKTGATLDVQFVQWGEAHDRFVTSIAGGTTPDVAETGTTWTAEFAQAGALAPLNEQVKAAGIKEDLVDGLVEAGTVDGELYGMPWYAGVRSVIYRTDVFKELNLQEPQSWDELLKTAQTIKQQKPDMIPWAVPGGSQYAAYPFIWGPGGKIATKEGDKWVSGLASPEARQGIEFYTDLALEHGLSSAAATTWDATDVLDNFAKGKLPMAILGSWAAPTLIEKNPDLEGKLGAFPIPGPDGGYSPSFLGGSHLSVFNSADNPELAWEFVKMMTTTDLAARWAEETNYFPGTESLLAESINSDDPMVKPFATQMVEAGTTVPVTPKFGAVQGKKTVPAMLQSILAGDKTVKQATSDAAAEVEEILNGK